MGDDYIRALQARRAKLQPQLQRARTATNAARLKRLLQRVCAKADELARRR
jgi:hypothetical protein